MDEGLEIELVGNIVRMIALPDGSGGVPDAFACSAKVVAGAGYQLHLLVFAQKLCPLSAQSHS